MVTKLSRVELPPPKVLVEPCVVAIEQLEVPGQGPRGLKFCGVNVRVWGRDGRVVGAPKHYGDHVEAAVEGEKLFRRVVLADGVLKREVELVFALCHAVALETLFLK